MSPQEALDSEPGSDAASHPPSIGAYLARQRRLRGIELDDLVKLTHIPRRSLERLEGGAFDGVTDGFVRGFVRTVAIAIGLDPDEAVMRMLAEPVARPGRAVPRAGVLLGIAALAALLIATGALLTDRAARPTVAAPAAEAEGRTVLRRDPVRALAREHGLLGPAPSQPIEAEAILPSPAGVEPDAILPPAAGVEPDAILPPAAGVEPDAILPPAAGVEPDAILPSPAGVEPDAILPSPAGVEPDAIPAPAGAIPPGEGVAPGAGVETGGGAGPSSDDSPR